MYGWMDMNGDKGFRRVHPGDRDEVTFGDEREGAVVTCVLVCYGGGGWDLRAGQRHT